MLRDLVSNISAAVTLAPAARTASTQGTGVDLRDFGSAAVIVVAGAITDGTHAIAIEESDDNATWNPVDAADLIGSAPTLTSANGNRVFEVGCRGRKRYIRASVTVTGATAGGVYGAIVVRGRPVVAPV